MKKKLLALIAMALALTMIFAACGKKENAETTEKPTTEAQTEDTGEESNEAGETANLEGKGNYKIGWSTIYLTPSWMQQTNALMDERINYWKEKGVVAEYTVANANGDANQQISQIDNMISQEYDAIIIVAGSSTALNSVIEKANEAGIVTINFDSLVTSEAVTSKINTSPIDFGKICADWLANEINGEGKIVIMNGPAGVAVSDERNQGAKEALAAYPNIEIVTELNTEYNEGPAMSAIVPVLDANPDISGILALGGSQASASLKALQDKGMDLIPITGENYNGFLRAWNEVKDQGFSSICVAQPNWMGVLAIDQAVRALNGEAVSDVVVPIPQITNDNLSDFVPNDLPDDGFPIANISQADIDQMLGATA